MLCLQRRCKSYINLQTVWYEIYLSVCQSGKKNLKQHMYWLTVCSSNMASGKKMNEQIPNECFHVPAISAFLSWAYSTLTRQLEAVVIEVSTVRALRLRTNSRVHKAKHSHTGFHNGQANYSNMKVLVFAEPGHMQFLLTTANLGYDQK